jgi:hypothetical protein
VNPFLLHLTASLVSFQQNAHDIPPDQWDAIVGTATEHGLGPMLFWRLNRDHFDMQANRDFDLLIRSAHQTALEYTLKETAQREINAALRQANIPGLWLKGAALARTVYPQPTLRPMSDLDVLVPYEQRKQALEVVRDIGYDFYDRESLRSRSSGDDFVLKLTPHHYHLRGGIANGTILELHFQLLGQDNDLLSREQLQWFWEHKQTLRLDSGLEFDTLTPEAHLLYLCAHAILQHGETPLYLLRFFDLHQIITQIPLDWDVVIDQAVVFGWTLAVERALRRCVEFFSTPVPEDALDALARRRPVYEDTSRVWRLQGSGSRWERVRGRLRGLTTRERVRLITQIAFPTSSYMRQRYNIKPGRPAWPYYLYRWFDQTRDAAWSTWKHLTGQYR